MEDFPHHDLFGCCCNCRHLCLPSNHQDDQNNDCHQKTCWEDNSVLVILIWRKLGDHFGISDPLVWNFYYCLHMNDCYTVANATFPVNRRVGATSNGGRRLDFCRKGIGLSEVTVKSPFCMTIVLLTSPLILTSFPFGNQDTSGL